MRPLLYASNGVWLREILRALAMAGWTTTRDFYLTFVITDPSNILLLETQFFKHILPQFTHCLQSLASKLQIYNESLQINGLASHIKSSERLKNFLIEKE
jgi:hypothetical protein